VELLANLWYACLAVGFLRMVWRVAKRVNTQPPTTELDRVENAHV
jgi:hypothetical protein